MKKFLKVQHHGEIASIGLLLIRVVVGFAFMHHGWTKINNPFAWMPAGSGTPAIFQALAALSEFGGGMAWMLGLVVPIASLGIVSTMLVALRFHILLRGDPFVGHGSSYESALVYFSIAVLMLTAGPGKFSLDPASGAWRRSDA
ncbi:MAG: DoxX family protein [Bdellovibrionota bacterium]